jgi:hypothetical protein
MAGLQYSWPNQSLVRPDGSGPGVGMTSDPGVNPPGAQPATAQTGDVFTGYPTITASDGTNAAKLAGLGFAVNPTTAWTTGQSMTVNGFAFNWSGAAWAAGAHA